VRRKPLFAKMDFTGNPYVGVYCASNDDVAFVPNFVTKRARKRIEEALQAETKVFSLGGSTVLGALMCLNKNGVIVTNFATEEELELLEGLRVEVISQRKLNAVGNNILCNDNGAIVHPRYRSKSIEIIEDVLDVEVTKGTVAGLKTVGSACITNGKGVLCHPYIKESESKLFEEVLKVPVSTSTANYGTPQIGACLVANNKGAVVGTRTTPIELGRIEEGLHLY
jgi:translation initiation factor 6